MCKSSFVVTNSISKIEAFGRIEVLEESVEGGSDDERIVVLHNVPLLAWHRLPCKLKARDELYKLSMTSSAHIVNEAASYL